MDLPTETFELTFYNLFNKIDSIQQYRNEEEARQAMKLFDEPVSAEMYSKITLSKTKWFGTLQEVPIDKLVFTFDST